MADLYGESEDMTSILRNLLQSSPTNANNVTDNVTPVVADGRGTATGGIEASSSFNFSDPGDFFAADGKGSVGITNAFSSGEFDASTSSMKRLGEFSLENKFENFDFNSENGEGSDMAGNQGQGRSSKRSRSAEIHNLSEKRRRSRINEKLKALQTLIPNSNKTDKASMLDEAIEYLKQLQLQVQMLTMRNGLSLYPGYMPGALQPMQMPPSGIDFDEGILTANRGADTYPGNQEVLMHTAFDISNQNPSNQPILLPSMTANTNSEASFAMQPSIHNRYGLLNHLASSKDICRDDTISRLQLDISCSGNNSSPGVSSS